MLSDVNLAPMALGGLTNGVTVRAMAAAYATFADEGVYREARTYTKVTDASGKNIILDNILPSDIYIKGKELRFNTEEVRVVFLIKFLSRTEVLPFNMVQQIFPDKNKDYVISISEQDIVVVKEIKGGTDILKDHRNIMASDFLHFLFFHFHQVTSAK